MKLLDAVMDIQGGEDWGIWAEFPFTPESEARYGQRQFENGGLRDDKVYFSNGLFVNQYLSNYVADLDDYSTDKELMDAYEEAARDYISVVNNYFQ